MSYIPRPYQEEQITALYNHLSTKPGNPLVASITGTGKSIIPAEFIRRTWEHWPQQRFMVLCHVQEVLASNYKAFRIQNKYGDGGVYHAGLGRRDTDNKTIFAGINSVYKKPKLFGHRDIIFVDEVHTVSGKAGSMYDQFINAMLDINPNLKIAGLTATPYRIGQGLLTDPITTVVDGKPKEQPALFSDIVSDNTNMAGFDYMLSNGWIAPLVSKKTETRLETGGVKTSGGDFVQHELQKAVDKMEITNAALDEVMAYGHNRNHWLFYTTGIEHATHVAQSLRQRGVSTGLLHGKLPKHVRDDVVQDFYHGRIRALVNVGILTTGFDMPHLDMGVILRPTKSPGLWSQILGRFLRPFEGKEDSLILDFTHNTATLGPVNDIKPPKKKGTGTGSAPVKLCEFCLSIVHASTRVCPDCGAEFPPGPPKLLREPTDADIMRDNKPLVKTFDVERVGYTVNKGRGGRPDSMLVTYYTKNKERYKDWICFEHSGLALHQAHEWWEERSDDPAPVSVADAVILAPTLEQPSQIRAWINAGKYPTLLAVKFGNREVKA